MKLFTFLIFLLHAFASCTEHRAENLQSVGARENIFQDKTMRQISDYQDQRNVQKLLPFLTSPNNLYRKQAAMAFGSVQDTSALTALYPLLFDSQAEVARAAAFAIGQTHAVESESKLIASCSRVQVASVKAEIYEAIGKCGTSKGLEFLSAQSETSEQIVEGQLWGVVRLAQRNITNTTAANFIISVLKNKLATSYQKEVASIFFGRLKIQDTTLLESLVELYPQVDDPAQKSNLISYVALNYSPDNDTWINEALTSKHPEVTIACLRALPANAYYNLQAEVTKLLTNKSINVAVAASEFFIKNGTEKHGRKYISWASSDKNWRVSANLFHAALKVATNKKSIVSAVSARYASSTNTYEKAFLLRSLGQDINSFKFVARETFTTSNKVVASYGMEALVAMRADQKFDYYNDRYKAKGGSDLYKEFALIFKQALNSNEVPLIALAAGVLRSPDYNYINTYDNTYFLTQALHRLELPEQVEAYIELSKTIAYFSGEEYEHKFAQFNNPTNWKLLKDIQQNEQVTLKTTKGDVVLALKVNEAPASVANFIRLAKSDYFDNISTHRVVPNFVVQGGCPRGDGWGGPDFSIRSEFSLLKYTTGSVGMASAGKDTESSQWFITHCSTPHLDGRYTIFAEVIQGHSTVQRMEVGDKILDVTFQ